MAIFNSYVSLPEGSNIFSGYAHDIYNAIREWYPVTRSIDNPRALVRPALSAGGTATKVGKVAGWV